MNFTMYYNKQKSKNLILAPIFKLSNKSSLFLFEMSESNENFKVTVEVSQAPVISDDLNNELDYDELMDEDRKDEQEVEEDVEFHVNLDKAPPTLQNTILNEKVYLNESLKNDEQVEINGDELSEDKLNELYKSLGLNESSFDTTLSLSEKELYRKEALHLYGVDDASTNEIFEYFKEYQAFSVEWINDSSCNVVWKNELHAAYSLAKLSASYDENIQNDESKKGPPQGTKWRKAFQPLKGKDLYMRFARKADKKIKGAESRSKFYVKYGNPNYGNMTGLISQSKRMRLKAKQLNDATSGLDDDGELEEGESSQRKLTSYNLDEPNINDLEEFGTVSDKFSTEGPNRVRNNLNFNKREEQEDRSIYKRKKMSLYADEMEEMSRKAQRRA
jgi:hypothetical protein